MGSLVQRIARDGERIAEVEPYPFPATEPTRERCPACGRWLRARTDGRVRLHGPRDARCPGALTLNARKYVVVCPPLPGGVTTVYRFAGRRNAEVIANQYRRHGAEPIVYRVEEL